MDREYLEELLTRVKDGELPVEKALEALRDFPNAIAAYVGEGSRRRSRTGGRGRSKR